MIVNIQLHIILCSKNCFLDDFEVRSHLKKMHREGFEPSRVATSHLECDSLDRSDICARY